MIKWYAEVLLLSAWDQIEHQYCWLCQNICGTISTMSRPSTTQVSLGKVHDCEAATNIANLDG